MKKWVEPKIQILTLDDTNTMGIANCNPTSGRPWPSGIEGPVWNDGRKVWECSSMGQAIGTGLNLPIGDPNRIERCSFIDIDNKTCRLHSTSN